jgi:hypothetical protein
MVPAAAGLAVACVLVGAAPSFAAATRGQQWWLGELHVTQAWPTTRGAGVTVAVLDTGVARHQPDLAGAVLPGPDLTHSGETSASPYYDAHGTAVASLIAGHGHGTGGAAGEIGVAPAAHILSVRVTLGAGDPLLANSAIAARLPAAIATGIKYAVQQGAQVIDLPLDPAAATATSHPVPAAAAAAGRAAEQAAVRYALGHGAVLVAPAGDGATVGNAINYPAAYSGVISVGAFNRTFLKAPFSSRQHYVTLTAPGDGVVAAAGPHGYTTLKSTSAASAIVAGIAALVRAQYPELSGAQVTQALEKGTAFRPNGKTGIGSGFGTADATRALAAAASIAGPQGRAGGGAVSRSQPDVPAVSGQQAITKRAVTRAALISGAVLIVLLIPIGILAWLRRRRRAQDQAAAVPAELDWPDYTEGSYREPEYAHAPRASHGFAPAGAGYGTGANGGPSPAAGPKPDYGWPVASEPTEPDSGPSDPGRNFLPAPASGHPAGPQSSGRRSGTGPGNGSRPAGPVFGPPAEARDPGVHPPATRSRPPAEFDPPAGPGYPEASQPGPGTASGYGEPAAAGHADLFHRNGAAGRGPGAHSSGTHSSGTHSSGAHSPRPHGAGAHSAPGSPAEAADQGTGDPGAHSPAGHSAGNHGAGSHGAGNHSSGTHSAGTRGTGGRFRFGAARSATAGGLGAAGAADAGAPGPDAPGPGAPGPGAPGTGLPPRNAPAGNGSSPGGAVWRDDGPAAGPDQHSDADAERPPSPGEPATLPRRNSDETDPPGGFTGSSSVTGMSPRAPSRPSAVGHVPPAPRMTPIHRSGVGHSPQTSGAPPWEPAVRPDSELPWASTPASPASGPDRPAPSVWDAGTQNPGPSSPSRRDGSPGGGASQGAGSSGAADSWPSGQGLASNAAGHRRAAPDNSAWGSPAEEGASWRSPAEDDPAWAIVGADPSAWGDSPGQDASDEQDEPRWSPNASTETFPAVPDPDDGQA